MNKMKKSNWHGGKGSGRRSSQDDAKYADNWDKIFGKSSHISNDTTRGNAKPTPPQKEVKDGD